MLDALWSSGSLGSVWDVGGLGTGDVGLGVKDSGFEGFQALTVGVGCLLGCEMDPKKPGKPELRTRLILLIGFQSAHSPWKL